VRILENLGEILLSHSPASRWSRLCGYGNLFIAQRKPGFDPTCTDLLPHPSIDDTADSVHAKTTKLLQHCGLSLNSTSGLSSLQYPRFGPSQLGRFVIFASTGLSPGPRVIHMAQDHRKASEPGFGPPRPLRLHDQAAT